VKKRLKRWLIKDIIEISYSDSDKKAIDIQVKFAIYLLLSRAKLSVICFALYFICTTNVDLTRS
jgi:hypothetical protein